MQYAVADEPASPWACTKGSLAGTLSCLPAIQKDEIKALEQQRTQCMKTGHYKGAQAAERQLERLRLQQEEQQLKALQELHEKQTQQLEQQLHASFVQFTAEWDERMAALHARGEEQKQQLQQKHLEETAAAAAAPQQQRLRLSPEVLNMRRIEETLVAQRQFEQALEMKRQADRREAAEVAAHGQQGGKQGSEGSKLASKQAKELEALGVRTATARDEAIKKQQRELQRLMKHYQAMRQAAERAQATERLQLEVRLRGELGIKRPNSHIEPHDLGTSLADTPLRSAHCRSLSPPRAPATPLSHSTQSHMASAQQALAAARSECGSRGSEGGRGGNNGAGRGSSPRSPGRPKTGAAVGIYAATPKPLTAASARRRATASSPCGQQTGRGHEARAGASAGSARADAARFGAAAGEGDPLPAEGDLGSANTSQGGASQESVDAAESAASELSALGMDGQQGSVGEREAAGVEAAADVMPDEEE